MIYVHDSSIIYNNKNEINPTIHCSSSQDWLQKVCYSCTRKYYLLVKGMRKKYLSTEIKSTPVYTYICDIYTYISQNDVYICSILQNNYVHSFIFAYMCNTKHWKG